jgi:hypothetical protein
VKSWEHLNDVALIGHVTLVDTLVGVEGVALEEEVPFHCYMFPILPGLAVHDLYDNPMIGVQYSAVPRLITIMYQQLRLAISFFSLHLNEMENCVK